MRIWIYGDQRRWKTHAVQETDQMGNIIDPYASETKQKMHRYPLAYAALGGGGAKQAEIYPMGLIVGILRGIRDHADAQEGNLDQEEQRDLVHAVQNSTFPARPTTCHQHNTNEDQLQKNTKQTDVAKYLDGSSKRITYNNVKDRYLDEYTNEEMDMPQTQAAIIDEMNYWNDRVWLVMQQDEAKKKYPNAKFVGGRWVMTIKGDAENPKIRC